ncbi:MAG: hypothetical protein Fur0022_42850 [Anaerolineales bacterium]
MPIRKITLSRKRVVLLLLGLFWGGCLGVLAVVEFWPSAGAQMANVLRNLFGPRVVAQLETVVFQVQDTVRQWQYQTGVKQAEAPWGNTTPTEFAPTQPTATASLPTGTPSPTPTHPIAPSSPIPTQTPSPTPTLTPTPYIWNLSPLPPLGSLEGEGLWQPYLFDQNGQMVAARTFLQPDPDRPYAIVAVVAFDLTQTDLHFVLGFSDPGLPDGPKGDGLIPEADRSGNLLAAFNGGFRTANGMFGAMSNGIVALPPLPGMATVGIYQNGEVRIGSWGDEITESPTLLAWRQNCPLVVQDGEISSRVYNDSIVDWGGTISNQIVTRRSGMGLDQEAKTLFYFAGPSLSMPALADAMLTAGVYDGMLLDINHFWVHFTAISPGETGLIADPLLPEDMIDHVDRYLNPSPVDFFYVTLQD